MYEYMFMLGSMRLYAVNHSFLISPLFVVKKSDKGKTYPK